MSVKYFSDKSGFSFIEVLVAAAILALLIVGVLTMTTAHIKTNSFAIHHTKAVQLAEEAVERLLRVDFTDLTGFSTTVENFGQIENYPDYSRTISVIVIDAENCRISASVQWRSQGINSRPIRLSIIRTL